MFTGPSSSASELRESDHREFARAIRRRAAVTGLARHRGDIHDRALALLRHVRDTGLRAQERALGIHRHHAVPRAFRESLTGPTAMIPALFTRISIAAKFRHDLRRHPLEVGVTASRRRGLESLSRPIP